MKTLFIWLAIMAQASSCWAWGVLGLGGSVPAGTCTSQSTLITHTAGVNSADGIDVRGQEFTLASAATIYSVSFQFSNSSSGVVDFRIGTSRNLTTYSAAVTGVSITSDGMHEFILPTPLSLSAGTYYAAVSHTSGVINVMVDVAGGYAGGEHIYGGDWSTSIYADRDMNFVVKTCD